MTNVLFGDFNGAPVQGGTPPPAPSWASTQPSESYDRDEVRAALLGQLESVLGYLYPNGFSDPKGHTFYIGSLSGEAGESLNVVLHGERAGLWHDFATADGGDIFSLWQAARGLPSFRETIRDAALYTGAAATVPRRAPTRKQPKGGEAWGKPAHTYQYHDANHNIVAEVDRFEWIEDEKPKKVFRPWDVATRQHRAPDHRPLYNLPDIIRSPEIVIVEGEKAADALIGQNICATTAMGGAAAPLEKTDWSPMKGRKVLIWPDNDAPGKAYAERLKPYLEAQGALDVSILSIPQGRPEKWDAADAWDEDLGAILTSMRVAVAETTGVVPIKPTIFVWRDPASIAPRPWLYGKHLLRRQVSVTVAPGGVGKSSMTIVEALSMASGKELLGEWVKEPMRVWLYNLEDPRDELERRIIGAMMHHGITQADIEDRLCFDSGRERTLCTAIQGREGVKILKPEIEAMAEALTGRGIDVLVVDPFVSSHQVSENDNGAIDMVAKEWARLSDRCNCAIELVHHTRKLNGEVASSESSRGAVALLGAARSARVLNRMTDAERENAGLMNDEATYFSVTRDKANLAPSGKRVWRKMASVDLGQGDSVGVTEVWQWPDAFDGVTADDAKRVQSAIFSLGHDLPRENVQAANWVGKIVAHILGMDLSDKSEKSKVKTMIRHWIETDVLCVEHIMDPAKGREVPFIGVGKNLIGDE